MLIAKRVRHGKCQVACLAIARGSCSCSSALFQKCIANPRAKRGSSEARTLALKSFVFGWEAEFGMGGSTSLQALVFNCTMQSLETLVCYLVPRWNSCSLGIQASWASHISYLTGVSQLYLVPTCRCNHAKVGMLLVGDGGMFVDRTGYLEWNECSSLFSKATI